MARWMKWILAIGLGVIAPAAAIAQNAAITDFCTSGATAAVTQGLPSGNTVQGVVPRCTVTVYNTGTGNLATIYSNVGGTALSNPFTASQIGQFVLYAPISACYDVVLSGGAAPNTFPSPIVLTDKCPGGGGGGGGGGLPTGTGVVAVNGGAGGLATSQTISPLVNGLVPYKGVYCLGDSTVQGAGAPDATTDFCAYLNKDIPGYRYNLGFSGAWTSDVTSVAWLTWPLLNQNDNPFVTYEGGINNANYTSGISYVNQAYQDTIAGIAHIDIPLNLQQMSSTATSSSGWTPVTSIPAFAVNPAMTGTPQQSTTNGNTVTYTLPAGANLVYWWGGATTSAGTFTVSLNGTLQTNYCTGTTTFNAFGCNGQVVASNSGGGYAIFGQLLSGGNAGSSNTLVVTVTSATGAGNTVYDFGAATVPVTLQGVIGVQGVIPQYGDANSAATAAYNTKIQSAYTALVAAGFTNLFFADVRTGVPAGAGYPAARAINTTTDFVGGPTCPGGITPLHLDSCAYNAVVKIFESAAAAAGHPSVINNVGGSNMVNAPLLYYTGLSPFATNFRYDFKFNPFGAFSIATRMPGICFGGGTLITGDIDSKCNSRVSFEQSSASGIAATKFVHEGNLYPWVFALGSPGVQNPATDVNYAVFFPGTLGNLFQSTTHLGATTPAITGTFPAQTAPFTTQHAGFGYSVESEGINNASASLNNATYINLQTGTTNYAVPLCSTNATNSFGNWVQYVLKDNADTGTFTFTPSSPDKINGSTSPLSFSAVPQYTMWTVRCSKTGSANTNLFVQEILPTPPAGGGSTIPSTSNLIAGNGSGNGADSGIAASNVGLLNATQTFSGTDTFTNPVAASVTGTAANVTGVVSVSHGGVEPLNTANYYVSQGNTWQGTTQAAITAACALYSAGSQFSQPAVAVSSSSTDTVQASAVCTADTSFVHPVIVVYQGQSRPEMHMVDYGVRGDAADNRVYAQMAIDACLNWGLAGHGYGSVLLPAGDFYFPSSQSYTATGPGGVTTTYNVALVMGKGCSVSPEGNENAANSFRMHLGASGAPVVVPVTPLDAAVLVAGTEVPKNTSSGGISGLYVDAHLQANSGILFANALDQSFAIYKTDVTNAIKWNYDLANGWVNARFLDSRSDGGGNGSSHFHLVPTSGAYLSSFVMTGFTFATSSGTSVGTGAVAGTPVVSGGAITSVPMTSTGSLYSNAFFTVTDSGGTCTGVVLSPNITAGTGALSINVINGGTGCVSPSVAIASNVTQPGDDVYLDMSASISGAGDIHFGDARIEYNQSGKGKVPGDAMVFVHSSAGNLAGKSANITFDNISIQNQPVQPSYFMRFDPGATSLTGVTLDLKNIGFQNIYGLVASTASYILPINQQTWPYPNNAGFITRASLGGVQGSHYTLRETHIAQQQNNTDYTDMAMYNSDYLPRMGFGASGLAFAPQQATVWNIGTTYTATAQNVYMSGATPGYGTIYQLVANATPNVGMPPVQTVTATTTSGSTTVNVASVTNLVPTMSWSGSGIPSGTTITAVGTSTITLSNAPTTSVTAGTYTATSPLFWALVPNGGMSVENSIARIGQNTYGIAGTAGTWQVPNANVTGALTVNGVAITGLGAGTNYIGNSGMAFIGSTTAGVPSTWSLIGAQLAAQTEDPTLVGTTVQGGSGAAVWTSTGANTSPSYFASAGITVTPLATYSISAAINSISQTSGSAIARFSVWQTAVGTGTKLASVAGTNGAYTAQTAAAACVSFTVPSGVGTVYVAAEFQGGYGAGVASGSKLAVSNMMLNAGGSCLAYSENKFSRNTSSLPSDLQLSLGQNLVTDSEFVAASATSTAPWVIASGQVVTAGAGPSGGNAIVAAGTGTNFAGSTSYSTVPIAVSPGQTVTETCFINASASTGGTQPSCRLTDVTHTTTYCAAISSTPGAAAQTFNCQYLVPASGVTAVYETTQLGSAVVPVGSNVTIYHPMVSLGTTIYPYVSGTPAGFSSYLGTVNVTGNAARFNGQTNTSGPGLPFATTAIHLAGQTGNISAQTLETVVNLGAQSPGNYQVSCAAAASSVTATPTLTYTLGYQDPFAGARTTLSPSLTLATSGAQSLWSPVNVQVSSGAALTVLTTLTGTATYNFDCTALRLY